MFAAPLGFFSESGVSSVFPVTAAALQSAMGAGGLPSYIWLARGTGPVVDLIAGEPLATVGSPTFEVDVSATFGAGEYGITHADNTTTAHEHASSSFADSGSGSIAVLHVCTVASAPASSRSLWAKRGTGPNTGFNGYISNLGRCFLFASDGSNSVTAANTVASSGTGYFSSLMWRDNNTALCGVSTPVHTKTLSGSALGSLSNSAQYAIGRDAAMAAAGQTWVYHAIWLGTAAEGLAETQRANFDTAVGL